MNNKTMEAVEAIVTAYENGAQLLLETVNLHRSNIPSYTFGMFSLPPTFKAELNPNGYTRFMETCCRVSEEIDARRSFYVECLKEEPITTGADVFEIVEQAQYISAARALFEERRSLLANSIKVHRID